jgi:agmatinase
MWKPRRDESLRQEQLHQFDPEFNLSSQQGIFGLPFSEESAAVVIEPMPWDVTVSYREGTAEGPDAIRAQSSQLDLYDLHYENLWREGIWMAAPRPEWHGLNEQLRPDVRAYLHHLEGRSLMAHHEEQRIVEEVNRATHRLGQWVEERTASLLEAGKIPAWLGGEHSVPLGAMRAIGRACPGFTLLQIDAHADLRPAYEGFTHSHASIIHNALEQAAPGRVVQVGVRDLSAQERGRIEEESRIHPFFDYELQRQAFAGCPWDRLCDIILEACGETVYISFDIDGLEGWYAPGTGTPVPGGLSFGQATHLLRRLAESGRRILGFDLCEVAPGQDEWDAIVGARMLYQLCLASLRCYYPLSER